MVWLAIVGGLIGAVVALLVTILVYNGISDMIECPPIQELAKTCNDAKNTVWIIIGVAPIALFFVLFIIFSGTSASTRVLNLDNIEKRAKAMQRLGVDHILKKTHAVLIDRSKRGNELYELRMIPNYPLKFLKYSDPSTIGKIYGGFVPSETRTADEGMGWKYQITEEEYQNDLITEA